MNKTRAVQGMWIGKLYAYLSILIVGSSATAAILRINESIYRLDTLGSTIALSVGVGAAAVCMCILVFAVVSGALKIRARKKADSST
jgi:uncharacterized membrane protein